MKKKSIHSDTAGKSREVGKSQDQSLSQDEVSRLNNAVKYLDGIRSQIKQAGTTKNRKWSASSDLERHNSIRATPIGTDFSTLVFEEWMELAPSKSTAQENNSEQRRFLGRFQVVRKLGEGGFAVVFLVFDPRLEREVALKIPKPGRLTSEIERARFDREAKAAAMLNHPHIVPILETGNFGPVQYIASGFCDGPTLSNWLKDQPSKAEEAVVAEIVKQLSDAVHHAHQRGILHRDLKPGNVLVRESSDEQGSNAIHVSITDFGLAKQIDNSQISLTVDGAVVGTPAYMSPEQARGNSTVTELSDIYSLGVILYELLTGKLPHVGASHVETLHIVSTQSAPRPGSIRPNLSKDLEAICMKAMNPVADQRYDSAFHMFSDLQNWLQGNPITARRVGPLDTLKRWFAKNPVVAFLVSAIFVSLAVGIVLTTSLYHQANKNLSESNEQRERALSHLGQLEATVDLILAEITPEDEQDQRLDESEVRILNRLLAVHKDLVQQETENLNVSLELIDNYVRVARIFDLLGDFKKSIEYADTAIKLIDTVGSDHRNIEELRLRQVDVAFMSFLTAYRNGSQDDNDAKLAQYKRIIDSVDEYQPQERVLQWNFNYYRHLGLVQKRKKDFESAEDSFQQAFQYIDSLVQLRPQNAALQNMKLRSMYDLANSNWNQKRRDTAIEYYRKLIHAHQELPDQYKNLPHNLSVTADCRSNLGHAYVRTKRPDEALAQFELANQLYQKIDSISKGMANERWVHLLVRIGDLASKQDLFQRSLEACEAGLEIAERIPNSRFQLKSKIALLTTTAEVLFEQGKQIDIARKTIQQAVEIGKAALEKYPKDAAPLHTELGRAYFCWALQQFEDGNQLDAVTNFQLALVQFEACHQNSTFRASPKKMPIEGTAILSDFALADGEIELMIRHWDRLILFAPEEPKFYVAGFEYLTATLEKQSNLNDNKVRKLKSAALGYLKNASARGFQDNSKLGSYLNSNIWSESSEFKNLVRSLGYHE